MAASAITASGRRSIDVLDVRRCDKRSNKRARDIVAAMRLVLVLALATALVVRPARADDDKPPAPHRHSAMWYGGWSYVGVGGVATLLVGVALTTRDDSASSTAGWCWPASARLTWVAGALLLRFGEKRALAVRRY